MQSYQPVFNVHPSAVFPIRMGGIRYPLVKHAKGLRKTHVCVEAVKDRIANR